MSPESSSQTRVSATFSHPFTPTIDREGFARELDALRAELEKGLGQADYEHMLKLESWARWCTLVGYGTAWMGPNLVSMTGIALGNSGRWAIMMHHIGHKGLDKIEGVPERYTSKGFAQGKRRLLDWFEWMLPEAWHHEHNVLHHYHTGEMADPDLVEENVEAVRKSTMPKLVKYGIAAFYAATWKFTYYAPNTFQILKRSERRRERGESGVTKDARGPEAYFDVFDLRTADGREFWRRCLLPYGVGRFVIIPAMYLPLGPLAVGSAWLNSLGAEVLANLHSFCIIAPNHAGDDMYRFEGVTKDRAEFYLRQVMGSVNYNTGGDLRDFLQGFLNYQIEHHLFPDLPPKKLQQAQPRVKAICEKYGVPYVQQPMMARVKKLFDIMVGNTDMRWAQTRVERSVEQSVAAAE